VAQISDGAAAMERGFVGEGAVVCARQPGSNPITTHAIIVSDTIDHVGKLVVVPIHESSQCCAQGTQALPRMSLSKKDMLRNDERPHGGIPARRSTILSRSSSLQSACKARRDFLEVFTTLATHHQAADDADDKENWPDSAECHDIRPERIEHMTKPLPHEDRE
jgi:hypothetical protein